MQDKYDDRFAEKYKVSSARNKDWNYSSPGKYHITICAVHHNNFFGKIINGEMVLSKMGIVAKRCLVEIPDHFKNIILDEYVVMPSHVHVLIEITVGQFVETPYMASLQIVKRSKQTIPLVVQQYKSAVTRLINPKKVFFAWQDRYYDEIIKDEKHYWAVKKYIQNNVKNWDKDEYNRDVKIGI